MARDFYYDDSQLQKLFAELEPKRRAQAFRGAFKRAADTVRKTAISNLRSKIHSNKDLERGVRSIVYKKKAAGFRVTVGTEKANKKGKGEAGYYLNKQNRKKAEKGKKPRKLPVLIWAEDGTDSRKTKTKTKVFRRSRKGHPTGRMKRYGFMAKARNQVEGSITATLHDEIRASVVRIAKKYGCT